MSGGVLLGGAHVDEHDVAGAQSSDEFFSADRFDVFSEVVAGGAFHLPESGDRGIVTALTEIPQSRSSNFLTL